MIEHAGRRIRILGGREWDWDWVTPRPASRNVTGLEVIEEPRSAWMVSAGPSGLPGMTRLSALLYPAMFHDATLAKGWCRLDYPARPPAAAPEGPAGRGDVARGRRGGWLPWMRSRR